MPHRPILARRLSANQQQKKVTHWDEVAMGERGQKVMWLPKDDEELVVNSVTTVGAIAATFVRPAVIAVPRNAQSFILLAGVTANTVAASGNARLRIYRSRNGSLVNDCAAIVSCDMYSINSAVYWQGMVPIINGGIYYEVTTAGTARYDMWIRIIGFVLE